MGMPHHANETSMIHQMLLPLHFFKKATAIKITGANIQIQGIKGLQSIRPMAPLPINKKADNIMTMTIHFSKVLFI
jgi:hypothetical protein